MIITAMQETDVMARILTLLLLIVILGCGDNNNGNLNTDSPAAMDTTTKHPDGTINGSVISTDTAAMRVVDSTKH